MGAQDTGELNVIGLIGPGGCGSVCSAEDAGGKQVAVKYFEGMAIRRNLLSSMLGRLIQDGWPEGVVPIISSELEGRPAMVVMPLLADTDADGALKPRSLQYRVDRFPGEDPWNLLMAVGRALAAMHGKRVAHGNLKPGNIFFDQNGNVLLSDWALGNMPGVSHLEFTDALLYQPPEQLRDPGGYLEEAGYRWDVFAFGVLAFRLTTGEYPRCNDTFIKVAPPQGETRREGIHADLPKIAKNLELHPDFSWPSPPADKEEESRREWIDRCLHLDPAMRPSSMAEVLAGFEAGERRLAGDIERDAMLDRIRGAERKASRWCVTACLVGGACLVLGALWQLASNQRDAEKKGRVDDTAELRSTTEAAVAAKAAAEKTAGEATRALDYERNIGIARLEASRLIGDRLFAWAMEKGHRKLPPLDGRLERLKSLEKYFEDFLVRIGQVPELADESARIKLQLAEISLAAGDAEKAISRLKEVLEVWKDNPADEELRFRMATSRLLLALLLKSNNDPRMEGAFKAARKALGEVRKEEVDTDRLQQLMAILDFHEANVIAARGDTGKALNQLMSATQSLNRLAEERPDAVVLRSVLATCYLSSATILEGMGNLGDAWETQMLAAQEIAKMLKENPKDPGLRLDLAGCYGLMAESALFSGDTAEAETRSTEAIRILEELLREQPDLVEAGARLASQIGLKAGLMRDKGETEAALKAFDEALRILEGLYASHPENTLAGYRLALLWWQKGKMVGMGGKREEEVELIRRAHGLMTRLEADKNPGGPPMEKIQRSSGYLLGDLGHALQLAGKKEEAIGAFTESASLWERLLESRPKSEEYQDSLAWCRQRIKELQ
ncbi:protein kinase [Luteolibacter sp. SL250]|uniref:protein kinase domain-containing protein n=1 Tax=Luteolibacter sp. SL250 TaxID=2995170 RepID=UPI00226DB4D5|nr:protein kinase [Luteolibacter sp. SL250]WAC17911.1 protein kinase [Luteolibacter sp. SL250]